RQLAEACVHAIDDALLRDNPLDDCARRLDALTRRRAECDLRSATRNGGDLFKRKRLAVQFKHKSSDKLRVTSGANVLTRHLSLGTRHFVIVSSLTGNCVRCMSSRSGRLNSPVRVMRVRSRAFLVRRTVARRWRAARVRFDMLRIGWKLN